MIKILVKFIFVRLKYKYRFEYHITLLIILSPTKRKTILLTIFIIFLDPIIFQFYHFFEIFDRLIALRTSVGYFEAQISYA